MRTFTLIQVLLLFSIATFGQGELAAFGLRYQNVTEYSFNNKTQNYEEVESVSASGAIIVDKAKIFIKGNDKYPDKTFIIQSKDFNQESNRDIYVCKLNNQEFVIAITSDKQNLTQISLDQKIIYDLRSKEETKSEIQFVSFSNTNSKKTPTYLYSTVDKKPLFQSAKHDHENDDLIDNYIATKVKEDSFKKKGKAIVQFNVDKLGKVSDARILVGKNKKINNFAIKLVESMPNWTPGEKDGQKVKLSHIIEVIIQ